MKHVILYTALLSAAALLLPGCSCEVDCLGCGVGVSVGTQEKVDTTATAERLEKLAEGIIMYTIDHDDNMPEKLSDVATEGYVNDAKLVIDPVTGREFGYVARLFQHSPIEKPEQFPMAFALYPQNKAAVVLYADKHVAEFRTDAENAEEFVEALHKAHPYDEDTIRVLRINAKGK